MAFIVKKKINGNFYYYLNENKRIGDKVKTKTIAYLGKNKKEAEKRAKEFLSKRNVNEEKRNPNPLSPYDYNKTMELASKRSLFYPAAEVYPNSPSGFWDFGPIGQAMKRKIIDFWRHEFVQKENMLEISGSQILPESVFNASGHLKSFADPIVQCQKCKKYERADKLISERLNKNIPESLPTEQLDKLISENKIRCPKCGSELGKVSKFNMMVETIVGKKGEFRTFLRPEACQSIFLNFARMVKTMRLKLPQGIAQAGGAFRNEISPRQSITRAIEFSQMEAEIFFDPSKIDEIESFDKIKNYKINILRLGSEKIESFSAEELCKKKIVPGKLIAYFMARTQQVWNEIGISLDRMRFREVDKDERAFYSLATFDFEVLTSIGWLELIANNYRTDYDLKSHMNYSKTKMEYTFDDGKKIIPHVWEVSAGVDRTLFALIENSMRIGKEGLYLSLNSKISAYHCGIFPLIKDEKIVQLAQDIKDNLQSFWFDVNYDSSGSIGRRYSRNDEIGTPFCITIDDKSLKNKSVTIRERDTQKQIRVDLRNLNRILRALIDGEISFESAEKSFK